MFQRFISTLLFTVWFMPLYCQTITSSVNWIRPDHLSSPAVWGIHNGITFSLWPSTIEKGGPGLEGGPRGLLRIGYDFMGSTYLINYIAIEPVVKGDMEFSEVSPSQIDGKWGKFIWAGDSLGSESFTSNANTTGKISHPDKDHPEVEELSLFLFIEKYLDGAHPYFKLSIRSDRPEELCIQIFNKDKSVLMERCALTATMGNYSRLRLLYLKNKIIDSRKLYAGYDDIDFAEKEPYPADQMLRNRKGDYLVLAESNEELRDLSAWPQLTPYLLRWGWRYRPFYKLTQYWRVDSADYNPSLQVRVNGRANYWGAESTDKSKYVHVPGGPAFENFELRAKYKPGQKFYFGLSRKPAKELLSDFK